MTGQVTGDGCEVQDTPGVVPTKKDSDPAQWFSIYVSALSASSGIVNNMAA